MASFHFEEAAYSHCCSKIETADEIVTCANHNLRFLSNLLLFSKLETIVVLQFFSTGDCKWVVQLAFKTTPIIQLKYNTERGQPSILERTTYLQSPVEKTTIVACHSELINF